NDFLFFSKISVKPEYIRLNSPVAEHVLSRVEVHGRIVPIATFQNATHFPVRFDTGLHQLHENSKIAYGPTQRPGCIKMNFYFFQKFQLSLNISGLSARSLSSPQHRVYNLMLIREGAYRSAGG